MIKLKQILSLTIIAASLFTIMGIKHVNADNSTKPDGAVFWEDFESGIDLSRWTQTTLNLFPASLSTLSTENVNGSNALKISNTNGNSVAVVAGDSSWYNYTVQATITPNHLGNGHASLAARVADPGSPRRYYRFDISEDGFFLMKYNPSDKVQLKFQPIPQDSSTTYIVKMVLIDNEIKCYINDNLLWDVTDSAPLGPGKIGVETWQGSNGSPTFDDISVVPFSNTAPTVTPTSTPIPTSTPTPTPNDADKIQFSVGSATGNAGDTVNTSVNIGSHSKMSAGTFELRYNTSLLECVSAVKGSVLNNGITDVQIDRINGKIVLTYINTEPMNETGSILDIQFKIKAGITDQVTSLNFVISELVDNSYTNIYYKVSQGEITVININYGDINGDNKITTLDSLMALQAATGKIILTDNQRILADVNKDGKVTSVDALMILQYASGRITKL